MKNIYMLTMPRDITEPCRDSDIGLSSLGVDAQRGGLPPSPSLGHPKRWWTVAASHVTRIAPCGSSLRSVPSWQPFSACARLCDYWATTDNDSVASILARDVAVTVLVVVVRVRCRCPQACHRLRYYLEMLNTVGRAFRAVGY
jgi:hypothetical protein